MDTLFGCLLARDKRFELLQIGIGFGGFRPLQDQLHICPGLFCHLVMIGRVVTAIVEIKPTNIKRGAVDHGELLVVGDRAQFRQPTALVTGFAPADHLFLAPFDKRAKGKPGHQPSPRRMQGRADGQFATLGWRIRP